MKKLPSMLPVAFMFVILAVLLVFMCLPIGQASGGAAGGVMELDGESLDTTVYQLNGEWEFYYGELLTPDDFTDGGGQVKTIEVPSSWDNAGYPLTGAATYRLTVQTDTGEPLMIYLPEISSAYTLWINGEIDHESGVVSTQAAEGSPLFENALVPVRTQGGAVEIILQISNYDFMSSGLTGRLLIGSSNSVLSFFFRTRLLYCMALGCILMTAFYHLALYVFRGGERVYLFFFALCALCFLRFLMETNGLNEYFGWIPMRIFGMRLYMVIFFLHSTAISVFTLFVFNRSFLRSFRYGVAAYVLLGVAFFSIRPLSAAYSALLSSLAILLFMLFVIILAIRSPVLREDKWTRLYFAALLLYFIVGAVSKIFLDNILFMTGLLTNMFLIMAQSLVLSKDYARAFELVEETNMNLECVVDERTAALVTVNESLSASEKSIREAVQAISHDLKTPLAVLGVHLEMTKEDESLSWDSVRHLEVAYNKHTDLSRLLANLLDAVNMGEGKITYNMGWVSLEQLMLEIPDRYEGDAEAAGVLLTALLNRDCMVWVDGGRIWSVFDNVIGNALRYTPPEGTIRVTAAELENGRVSISVRDTGAGIPAGHLPHIFERYYKADKSRGGSGSGLGLYIVKTAVEGMEGTVEARSGANRGTEIIITLKAKDKAKNKG